MKLVLALVLATMACAPQKPPPTGYYPRPYQAPPPKPEYPDPFGGQAYGGYVAPEEPNQPPYPEPYAQPYAPSRQFMPPPGPVMPNPQPAPLRRQDRYVPPPRDPDAHYSFNGRPATQDDLVIITQIERLYGGTSTPSGDYWYDSASGATGRWGGPTLGFLPAGLSLGGRLPPNASGGGNGRLTGVWLNGRELHPVDVQVMSSISGRAIPGRWWLDAQGNAGQDGGPSVMNLIALARQRGKVAASYYRSDGRGTNAFVGGGCVSVSTTSGSGSANKTTDYTSSGC